PLPRPGPRLGALAPRLGLQDTPRDLALSLPARFYPPNSDLPGSAPPGHIGDATVGACPACAAASAIVAMRGHRAAGGGSVFPDGGSPGGARTGWEVGALLGRGGRE